MKLIRTLVDIITEQDNPETVYITSEEYMLLLRKVADQAQAIPKLPKYRGKKLVVNGTLNLSGRKKITDLGDISITGNLDVSNTNIKSLDNVSVNGMKRFWDTPYQKTIERRKKQAIINDADERREDDVWNLNNTDTEGYMAHAVFYYAVREGLLKARTEEEEEELKELKRKFSELETQMENEEDEEKYDELSDEANEIEERIDELQGEYTDVYDLNPSGYHYELHEYTSIKEDYRFAVGTEEEADESLEQYYEGLIDDYTSYFSEDFLEDFVDGDSIADDWEMYIREDVEENADEVYNIPRELSSNQEEEIWLLEMEKWVYENEGIRAPISEPTREEGDVFDFEDDEGNRFQYRNTSSEPGRNNWVLYKDGQVVSPHQIYDDENTQEHEDERESRINDIEYEIEEIKDNPDGYHDESAIDDEVENQLYEIRRDPADYLKERGYDIKDYVDKDKLKDYLVRNGEYGELNGYDGNYDHIKINGVYYIVMRID